MSASIEVLSCFGEQPQARRCIEKDHLKWSRLMKKRLLVICSGLLCLALSLPAGAAPVVKVGARIRQEVGYETQSKELTQNGQDAVGNTFLGIASNSYWRAKFTSADRKVGALVELAITSSASLRHAYGWYQMGNLRFLAGQTEYWMDVDAPTTWLFTEDFEGFGQLEAKRKPQVGIEYDNGRYGFQLYFRRPQGRSIAVPLGEDVAFGADVYNILPFIALAGKYKTSHLKILPTAGWVHYQIEGLPSGQDDSFSAWAVRLPVILKWGGFYFGICGHYGINLETDFADYGPYALPVVKSDGSFEDTQLYGGWVDVGYSFGALAVHASVGFEHYTNDAWKDDLGYAEDSFDRLAFALNVGYKVHNHLVLKPEFAYFDHGDDPRGGEDAGNEWAVGVRIEFKF
jgi:hypothetical protein